jgi:hypothetical protein
MLRKTLLVMGLATVAGVGTAAAQATAMPAYYAPYRSFEQYEFGATLSFPDFGGTALEGLFGFGYKVFDFEVRGGFWDPGEAAETNIMIGGTGRLRVLTHTDEIPIDGALIAGIGAHFNGVSQALIPIGFSVGRRLLVEGSQVSITPFVEPVGLINTGGTDHFQFGFGLGADFQLSRAFDARLSVGFGDGPLEGFAISAVYVR